MLYSVAESARDTPPSLGRDQQESAPLHPGLLETGDFVYRGRIGKRIRHGNNLPSSVEAWTTAHHCRRQPVVRLAHLRREAA